jgi:NhaA family Na+:H+ antiporter
MTSLPKAPTLSTRTITQFMKAESAGGVLMLIAAACAMIIANSPLSSFYQDLVHMPVTFGMGQSMTTLPLVEWIKDILMVFFFLTVGMELKREIQEGVLADKRQILLPLLAAVGGMAVPALIFMAINIPHPEHWKGWAIPSATDIAFALAILLLASKQMPPALKIFLLAIAIFDDLGAIMVIAVFYSHGLALVPLLLAAVGIVGLYCLNRWNVTKLPPYMIIGVFLWFCLCLFLLLGFLSNDDTFGSVHLQFRRQSTILLGNKRTRWFTIYFFDSPTLGEATRHYIFTVDNVVYPLRNL